MDIATAAITLATCLKDIIRLVQELRRTIDKIPRNRRNAQKFSNELLEGLLEIETFYKAREALLEGTPELEAALTDLLRKTKSVQLRCVQLFTPSNKKGFRKVGATVNAWRNCDQVEEEIAELKDLVQRCYRRFSMMAVARLEQPVNQIAVRTTRIEETMIHLHENQNMMLAHMKGVLTTLQGTGLAMSNSASIYPSHKDVSVLYLHRQVETICTLLYELSATQSFAKGQPRGRYLLPSCFVVSTLTPSHLTDDAYREVIALALQIIGLLKGNAAGLSIHNGALKMIDLGLKLQALRMHPDAAAIGQWTVTMYRALVATHPAIYAPYLSQSLQYLSLYICNNGAAVIAMRESLEISRHQVQMHSTLQSRLDLAGCLNVSWYCATSRGMYAEKGLEVASEAVAICNSIRAELASAGETWLESTPPQLLRSSNPQPVDIIIAEDQPPGDSGEPISLLALKCTTARALYSLAFSLQYSKRIDEAYKIQLRSVAILEDLSQTQGDFLQHLAASYAHLATPAMREGRQNNESLAYAKRAVDLFRSCIETSPDICMSPLLHALWDYALLLQEAGRVEDAGRVSEEALNLVRKSNQTAKLLADALELSSQKLRTLKQMDNAIDLRIEAVTIYRTLPSGGPCASVEAESMDSEVIPSALIHLAYDLVLAGKDDDAVTNCKEAIDIYRARRKDSEDYSSTASLHLASSLSFLCSIQVASHTKDHDSAVKIGAEAISIYRNNFRILGTEFKEVTSYISALENAGIASFYAANSRAIATNAAVLEDLLMLRVDHKEAVEKLLMDTFSHRTYLLGKNRRVRESVRLHERQKLPLFTLPITEAAIAVDYLNTLADYADNLYSVGRFNDAFLALDKAVELGSPFISGGCAPEELVDALSWAHMLQAIFLNDFGRSAEAETTIKLSIDINSAFKGDLTPEDNIQLAHRYCIHASILRNLPGRLDDALQIGEKAVTLCRTFANRSCSALFTQAHLPRPIASYAQTVADSGDAHQALALIQESIEMYQTLRAAENESPTPWGYAEAWYSEDLLFFASYLMATGDCEAAFRALIECKGIYQDLMADIPVHFADYVVCLDLLAINRSALGFANEETCYLQDLEDRQQSMEVFSPELAKHAHIALERLRSSPLQVRLRKQLKDGAPLSRKI
ncbi:hypothetical protein DXG01_011745 [Tephrocybe rancida]|nr:hypothetical protein DXG01_011745 [Tephrocybe rancida]